MSLLKQLSLAAVFAASLFFVSDALADEKEKNPFTKEINAVKRAEKRLQKAKNNAARKRAETNLKKEKKALENAVKEETARYEKALKAVEEQLKLKNENEENSIYYSCSGTACRSLLCQGGAGWHGRDTGTLAHYRAGHGSRGGGHKVRRVPQRHSRPAGSIGESEDPFRGHFGGRGPRAYRGL